MRTDKNTQRRGMYCASPKVSPRTDRSGFGVSPFSRFGELSHAGEHVIIIIALELHKRLGEAASLRQLQADEKAAK